MNIKLFGGSYYDNNHHHKKDKSNNNIIIVAIVVCILCCYCISSLIGSIYFLTKENDNNYSIHSRYEKSSTTIGGKKGCSDDSDCTNNQKCNKIQGLTLIQNNNCLHCLVRNWNIMR